MVYVPGFGPESLTPMGVFKIVVVLVAAYLVIRYLREDTDSVIPRP